VDNQLNMKKSQQRAVSRYGLIECVPDAFDYISKILNAKVYDVCKETDLHHAPKLSQKLSNRVLLKREDQQPIYSFKLRGAYNKIAQMTPEEKQRGLTACSAGNHAQGVAFAAKALGLSAKIFMPTITPSIKVDAVRSFSNDQTEVILIGDTYDEAYAATVACIESENRVLVHPFNDPLVIAGQGVIGHEIIKQTTGENVDAVFVCVGGGGLISGIGLFLKSVKPSIKIIGVESADAASMTESLRAGELVELPMVGTFADGAAVKKVGDETFRLCQIVVDEMITVSTDEICAAIKDSFVDTRVVLEPAGALAVAGMTKYALETESKEKTFVAIASGANMDFDRLRFVSERADTSESLISVTIPERPGSFLQLYESIYPRNVTEFSYRLGGAASKANIFMSFQASSADDRQGVIRTLEREGFEPHDLGDNELAKVHGRHLVGGRAPAEITGEEVLIRFEFPERPGSLKRFLEALPEKINISLFHYRNHGADVGRVLVGMLAPIDQRSELKAYLTKLSSKGFTWREETTNDVYQEFLLEGRAAKTVTLASAQSINAP